jgi:hypothetical protein
MGDVWFTEYADEIARLVVDARACADACERFLRQAPARVHLLAAPAAVSLVVIDLIDQPPQLVLAAARLADEMAVDAADVIAAEAPDVAAALRTVAESARALLVAAM